MLQQYERRIMVGGVVLLGTLCTQKPTFNYATSSYPYYTSVHAVNSTIVLVRSTVGPASAGTGIGTGTP